jgi:hypothetical protein
MSAPQNIEREIKKNAVIKGLLLGVIVTSLSIFSFYFIIRAQAPALILIVMFSCSTLLPIMVSIFFCIDMRKKVGGYWGLRQSITGIFLMFLISYALLTIGRDLIFAKLIEPDMSAKVKTVMIEVKQNRLKAQGAPDNVIKSQINDLKKDLATPANVSLFDILNSYIKTIILLFAIAVVFGAAFKKEPPSEINAMADAE